MRLKKEIRSSFKNIPLDYAFEMDLSEGEKRASYTRRVNGKDNLDIT